MTIPKHYHAWKPALGGRGAVMVSALLTKAEIERQRQRGSLRIVRRWWKSRQAADQALRKAHPDGAGYVRACDLGDECPERAHILAN